MIISRNVSGKDNRVGESIEFVWDPQEFQLLLESCREDDAVNLTLRYLSDKDLQILEAGCGSGRVVKYLADLGFHNVHGIELNSKAVEHMNVTFPELQIIQGNILEMPYMAETFDMVVSYGVVEHFPAGVVLPLRKLYEVLKPGGTAIITVPSLNHIRHFVAKFNLEILQPRNFARAVRCMFKNKNKNVAHLYYSSPKYGDFFEYWLTPAEFEAVCREAGFEIVESLPIAHIDGLYHSFGPIFVRFKGWRFKVNRFGLILNNYFKKYPFFHNHMHACVLRRPDRK